IPLYCPEWTDHNVSDPGVTLIELFAWMVDLLLYRLNQVPRKHHIKLLELLGIGLEPPRAATAPVTFYLSAPQPQPVRIPRGTAVSTARAAAGPGASVEPVVFTTDAELLIRPAQLSRLLVRRRAAGGAGDGWQYEEVPLQRLRREFAPFSPVDPKPGEGIYFGFDEPLDHHFIGLDLNCSRAGGLNIIPEAPPLRWQVWAAGGWVDADVEEDGTGGLSWAGQVKLHVPIMARRAVAEIEAHWVRVQVAEPGLGQLPYATSPLLRDVGAVTWGATADATHAIGVEGEPLGRSDGSPGQVFYLENTPLLPRRSEEHVQTWQPGTEQWEDWAEVADFGASGAEDRHYTCDSATGEVRFGPALRQRDGSVRRYGAIPPRGAELRMSAYRYGGGTAGNVRVGALTELRAALAYVHRAANRAGAQGGLDQESLEDAMFRARNLLRTRYRAVTADDYESLTLHAFPGEVARARCLQTPTVGDVSGAGRVYVVVVPALPEEEATGYIPLARLALGDELKNRILAFLDERRLLTTLLDVRPAGYRRVRVAAQVVARPGADEERLQRDIVAALNRFVNPLRGGPEGTGWPFGRELYLSDLYACIQRVDGLLNVREIEMYWVDEADVSHRADRRIELAAHEVLVSDVHDVRLVAE
ncbi:MAG: putative baseplate assembly protein, partial [Chloroflexota bacterium]